MNVVIPARYGSTRFPGKPLALIQGKPLIQHTYENSLQFGRVIVATDDPRIVDCVEGFGGEAVMTPDCPTGSDRVAAAARALGLTGRIINIQGDWPCLDPKAVEAALEIEEPLTTAIFPIEDPSSPTLVKCVHSGSRALYFSRAPLPFGGPYYGHLGLYIFESDFLQLYASLEETPLQIAEDLEQLKCLEHGFSIGVAVVDSAPLSVDTPSDIAKVEEYLCSQNLSSSPAVSSAHLERD